MSIEINLFLKKKKLKENKQNESQTLNQDYKLTLSLKKINNVFSLS